jgi:hypothetical protein
MAALFQFFALACAGITVVTAVPSVITPSVASAVIRLVVNVFMLTLLTALVGREH